MRWPLPFSFSPNHLLLPFRPQLSSHHLWKALLHYLNWYPSPEALRASVVFFHCVIMACMSFSRKFCNSTCTLLCPQHYVHCSAVLYKPLLNKWIHSTGLPTPWNSGCILDLTPQLQIDTMGCLILNNMSSPWVGLTELAASQYAPRWMNLLYKVI